MENGTSVPHVLIVGGGTAGVTCALFLGRAGIPSTIFDRGQTLLKKAYIENLTGAKPLLGIHWLREANEQVAATNQVTTLTKQVLDIIPSGESFTAKTEDQDVTGQFVVLASGQGPFDYAPSLSVTTEPPLQPYVETNITVDRWGETSISKVFACGLLAGWPSQTVICAGSGANTAVRIVSLVKGEFWVDHNTLADAAAARARAAG